ncbi:OsmC family protein [Hydrogenophaga defluvii]|uniref:OsmC family protein n=1 Tax=Hydrogenophaga defluvii TaxID=249410 RepID=A0ABW2SC72_9BURK
MSKHLCTVAWENAESNTFTQRRYPRRHHWTFDGGAVVTASSSPHVVPTPYSDATAVDPEEAFVAALSSCHMLWFLDFAARAGWVVTQYRDEAIGLMSANESGQKVMTDVLLRPRARFAGPCQPNPSELVTLHHEAHQACFLANSVRTLIRCEPTLDTP